MTKDELRDKANDLPLAPGVYLMMDKTGQVIYVGKAKKLKNRVSQYFQDTASHNSKTKMMVSQVDRFDTILVRTEFEALVLENSLIKRHMPRYNILLKDDKAYPNHRHDNAPPNPPNPHLRAEVPAGHRQGAPVPEPAHRQVRRLLPSGRPRSGGVPPTHRTGRPHFYRPLSRAHQGAAGGDGAGSGSAGL